MTSNIARTSTFFVHSFRSDLYFRSRCVCENEITNSIQDAVLESLRLTHPVSWGMITQGQYVFWPCMQREILNKASMCETCREIGKNFKTIIPASKWKPHINCTEPNEEAQISFRGPITNEKDQDFHFLPLEGSK